MKVDENLVDYVARLSRLHLEGEEKARLAEQLGRIIAYVEKLNELDTDGVEPAFRVLRRRNVFRGDEPGEMLPPDEALANAPDRHEDAFRVPAVLPND